MRLENLRIKGQGNHMAIFFFLKEKIKRKNCRRKFGKNPITPEKSRTHNHLIVFQTLYY